MKVRIASRRGGALAWKGSRADSLPRQLECRIFLGRMPSIIEYTCDVSDYDMECSGIGHLVPGLVSLDLGGRQLAAASARRLDGTETGGVQRTLRPSSSAVCLHLV